MRRLLPERLTLERTAGGNRVTGMASFGPLMAGIVLRQAMVPPEKMARGAQEPIELLVAA